MLAVLLLTFGAINGAVALSVETCTQGSADSLYGGFLTLLLYLAGNAAVLVRPPPLIALAALVPAAAMALWHSLFALRFAWNYWFQDMSACHAMLGEFLPEQAGEWMDGGEPMLTVLWLMLGVLFWAAFFLVLKNGRRGASRG
jgi:hypothetical protein